MGGLGAQKGSGVYAPSSQKLNNNNNNSQADSQVSQQHGTFAA